MRFDVFMAYNWEDKQAVQSIATRIKEAGFRPWIDGEQVPPGTPFAKQIEIAIAQSNATAIFIGEKGIGSWQSLEIQMCLITSIKASIPVIPVILPNASVKNVPLMLQSFRWVEFSALDNEKSMEELAWGIQGNGPR